MVKRNSIRVSLCIVLSLLMLVDFAVFSPAPALGKGLDKKSVLVGAGVGAVAGAGIALAAPAIGGAIGAAGGIAGIGTAIVGGVAAVAGGIIGTVAAVGGAIASAVGAIGGFIAGIFASPLFIPALLVIGAAALGYYLYKRHKARQGGSEAAQGPSGEVLPGADEIYITPGDYDMSRVVPMGDQPAGPVSVGDSAVISIGGSASDVTISDEPPATVVAEAEVPAQAPVSVTESVPGAPTTSDSIKEAHDRYLAAYQKYTSLVTNSGGADPQEIQAALKDYRAAYNDYQTRRMTGSK